MRKPLLCLLTFVLVAFSAKGVSASPDCQRWLADYKKALAQKTATQHLLAARNRARAAARRKLAHLTHPVTPVGHPPTRISSVRPHLTPAQMLKRFDLQCGELPVENQVLDSRMSPDEFVSEVAMGGPVEMEGSPSDGTLLAQNTAPTLPVFPVNPDSPAESSLLAPIYGPIFGGGVPLAPGGPGTPSKPKPPTPGGPGSPDQPSGPPVVPPLSPVPEPSSVFLVLTGLFGVSAMGVKKRFH